MPTNSKRRRASQVRTLAYAILILVAGPACTGVVQDAATGASGGSPFVNQTGPGTLGNSGALSPDGLISPLRRLSETEYKNTIRDLFGSVPVPDVDLPSDEIYAGYATQSTQLTTGPAFETYLESAEAVGEAVAPHRNELLGRYCNTGSESDAQCVRAFVSGFGRLVFRRPATPAELDELVALHDAVQTEEASADGAFAVLVARLLLSPHFLYRVELGQRPAGEYSLWLEGFEVASRLSFFLWQSSPDDALLDAASRGTLDSSSGVAEQAERMLSDPRAESSLWSFHAQWLDLDSVAGVVRSQADYPEFTEDLKESFLAESRALVRHVAHRDAAPFRDLFGANYTFANDLLSDFYGMSRAGFDSPAPYPAGSPRTGILTHGAFLASHRNETADAMVVHRGLIVQRNVLCTPLGAPPANATTADVTDRIADPSCGGCHRLIDPVGFGLMEFDAIGSYAPASGRPGEIGGTGTEVDGSFAGAVELGARLGSSSVVRECYARNLFRYGLGRENGSLDEPSVAQAASDLNSGRVRDLIVSFVQSEAFRTRRTSASPGTCEAQ